MPKCGGGVAPGTICPWGSEPLNPKGERIQGDEAGRQVSRGGRRKPAAVLPPGGLRRAAGWVRPDPTSPPGDWSGRTREAWGG